VLETIRGRAAEFRAQLDGAARVQERLLLEIVHRHAGCEYGRRHGFGRITSAAEWARRVPIVRYENLRGDLDRMIHGERDVLLTGKLLAFEETGGSSGGRRLIPYTKHSLAAFRRGITVWLDDLYAGDPALASGTAYWSISPAGRARAVTAGGIPIGLESDLSYLGPALAGEIAQTLSVGPEVAALTDLGQWRMATCVQLAADERLTLISVWSPTFLLQLLEYMFAHGSQIAAAIPNPARAAYVAKVLARSLADPAALWPALRLISCWTHGSSGGFAARLASLFPRVTLQGKGLLATEALVSIPLRALPWPVLALESAYIELLDAGGAIRAATAAEAGGEYEILITNDSGLYRYGIGDRVRVHGFAGGAPLLEFVGRTGITSDLVGEKLDEAFVAAALRPLARGFAALAPEEKSYALLLDLSETSHEIAPELARRCDQQLRANPQYAYARDLGQLEAVRPVRCDDPLGRYLAWRLRTGQRLGDIKPPALIVDAAWRAAFT